MDALDIPERAPEDYPEDHPRSRPKAEQISRCIGEAMRLASEIHENDNHSRIDEMSMRIGGEMVELARLTGVDHEEAMSAAITEDLLK